MARVTRPGGRLVVCEFSHPTWAPFRTVYTEYLMRALPSVARRVSSNPDAYVYLAESIRAWPDQAALARRIAAAGWTAVGWRNLTGGIVALHRAQREPDGVSAPRPRQGVVVEHDLTSSEKRRPPWVPTTRPRTRSTRSRRRQGADRRRDRRRRAASQGKRDQSKANLKQAGEKVKDAFKN